MTAIISAYADSGSGLPRKRGRLAPTSGALCPAGRDVPPRKAGRLLEPFKILSRVEHGWGEVRCRPPFDLTTF